MNKLVLLILAAMCFSCSTLQNLLDIPKTQGFDTSQIIIVKQD